MITFWENSLFYARFFCIRAGEVDAMLEKDGIHLGEIESVDQDTE